MHRIQNKLVKEHMKTIYKGRDKLITTTESNNDNKTNDGYFLQGVRRTLTIGSMLAGKIYVDAYIF